MKYFKILLIPIFLISCSESKMLLKSLNKYQAHLDYLHDSKINDCDKSRTIALVGFDNQVFDSTTSVSRINHKVLPFIIYNYEESNFAIKLGQNSLEQNYSDFFYESFSAESQRTGCYTLTNNRNDAEYTLEIYSDTCIINSKYQRSNTILFFLFAYSMRFQELGFPAETDLVLTAKLKKSNNLIFEHKYSINKTQPFINAQTRDVNRLHSDFVTNMAESLSLSTKDCIEKIIIDINQVIEKQ